MTMFEKLEQGRKCAYEIGQMADFEQAYALWSDIADVLTGKDAETFAMIKEVLGIADEHDPRVSAVAEQQIVGEQPESLCTTLAEKKTAKHNADDTLHLFEDLFSKAQESGNFNALYQALAKCKEGQASSERGLKPENVRLGFNLYQLIYSYWNSVETFNKARNSKRKENHLEEKSVQSVYQVIYGKNRMEDYDLSLLVEMVNKRDVDPIRSKMSKAHLNQKLTMNDLFLETDAFIKLFSNIELHSRTRKRLDDIRQSNEEKAF